MQGVYTIGFIGSKGFGAGTIFLISNRVIGFDNRGCMIDGEYKNRDDGGADILMQVLIPPGMTVAFDNMISDKPRIVKCSFFLEGDLGGGAPKMVQMETGPIQICFAKIRDIAQ
ncbi:hypothetical protein ABNQ38_07715 (plasmid) [Azospirillum sp. A29]|uniref:hypothetical protein n=1 Tax=Azospirillum sp. A29 TaxID=3160606 RepID=UPI0036703255